MERQNYVINVPEKVIRMTRRKIEGTRRKSVRRSLGTKLEM